MKRRWLVEVCFVLFLFGACLLGASFWANASREQGYAAGERAGMVLGFQQGRQDGYRDGYAQGTTDGYENGYQGGEAFIECWVIQNHPYVYALWFNDAFSGVICP